MAWTLDALRARCGELKVNVRRNTNTAAYREGRSYGLAEESMATYIDNLRANNAAARSSYLAITNLKSLGLDDDVRRSALMPYVQKLHKGPFLWVARKGHWEFWHSDPDDNVLIMVAGRKRVRIVSPRCVQQMSPRPLGTNGKAIQSDRCAGDGAAAPHAEALAWECDVCAGDMLFIPAFFWHQVTSLGDENVSLNVFFGDGDKEAPRPGGGPGSGVWDRSRFMAKLMRPAGAQWEAFVWWTLNIVEQNRQLESFRRVHTVALPFSLAAFYKTQWHEEASAALLRAAVALVNAYVAVLGYGDATSEATRAAARAADAIAAAVIPAQGVEGPAPPPTEERWNAADLPSFLRFMAAHTTAG